MKIKIFLFLIAFVAILGLVLMFLSSNNVTGKFYGKSVKLSATNVKQNKDAFFKEEVGFRQPEYALEELVDLSEAEDLDLKKRESKSIKVKPGIIKHY